MMFGTTVIFAFGATCRIPWLKAGLTGSTCAAPSKNAFIILRLIPRRAALFSGNKSRPMLRMDVRNSFALQNFTEYPKVLCITMKVYGIWLNSSKRTIYRAATLADIPISWAPYKVKLPCFDGFELSINESKYIGLLRGSIDMLFNEDSVLRIYRVGVPLYNVKNPCAH